MQARQVTILTHKQDQIQMSLIRKDRNLIVYLGHKQDQIDF